MRPTAPRLIARRRGRARTKAVASKLALAAGGAALAGAAGFLDRRRRRTVRDTAAGTSREPREYDDTTLARKVETELFRPAGAPKGSVVVNAQHGVVELRGEVRRPEQVTELGAAAARVEGVMEVHNLLHTPGSPARHSPPSDPDEMRARADQPASS